MTDDADRSTRSDRDLMTQARAGDQAAFALLIRRHQDPLLNFFRRMGVSNDAEDLVQETFLRLFKYRKKYEPRAKFTTFLYRLAGQVRVDWWRKAERQRRLSEKLKAQGPKEPPGPETRIDMADMLMRLPDDSREIIVMRIYQGLQYADIALSLLRIFKQG